MERIMTYEFHVKEIQPQRILSIRGKAPKSAIAENIGEFLREVWSHIQKLGEQPVGRPVTCFHSVEEDIVDVEAGLPVAEATIGEGRITVSELPGGQVVSTYHFGPYDKLNLAEEALNIWVHDNAREEAGPSWQIYWTDPGEGLNPNEWKTEIFKPLKFGSS
jgi:effector-binding domain-containing protein